MSCLRLLVSTQGPDFKSHLMICRVFILAIIVCYGIQKTAKSILQADATLMPKTRICFSSMSSPFQSECLYCDQRLYNSTMIACIGQPMLSNNVTQTQALCIATACLQVLSSKVAANQLREQFLMESSTNSGHLLMSALITGDWTRRGETHDGSILNGGPMRSLDPNPQLRRQVRSLSTNRRSSLDLGGRFTVEQVARLSEGSRLTSGSRMMQSSALEANTSEPPTTTTSKAEVAVAASTTSAPAPVAPESSPKPSIMATEETRPSSSSSVPQPPGYTNFNQAYAKIYNDVHNHQRPFSLHSSVARPFMLWKPVDYSNQMSFADHLRTQQSSRLKWAAQQVAQLMQSISHGWAMKRSSLRNKWQSVSFRHSPVSFHQYGAGSYLDRWRQPVFESAPVRLQGYDPPSSQPIVSASEVEVMDQFS